MPLSSPETIDFCLNSWGEVIGEPFWNLMKESMELGLKMSVESKQRKVGTSSIISAETTPVSSLSSLIAAVLGSSPSSIPPYQSIKYAPSKYALYKTTPSPKT